MHLLVVFAQLATIVVWVVQLILHVTQATTVQRVQVQRLVVLLVTTVPLILVILMKILLATTAVLMQAQRRYVLAARTLATMHHHHAVLAHRATIVVWVVQLTLHVTQATTVQRVQVQRLLVRQGDIVIQPHLMFVQSAV